MCIRDRCKVKLLNLVNVHDCGTLINPALAEAQVHGGMSMAIGYGLSEELKFDEKTGKPLNNNLLDYKLSTFMDHPTLQAAFVENPEPTSPYGTKALGEPPACSPAPAIRNAILNATGVAFDACPITPHVLYRDVYKRQEFSIGCDENGIIQGVAAEVIADTGAYASLGGPVLERACTHAAGPYNYQNFEIDGWAYYTNNPPACLLYTSPWAARTARWTWW